VTRTGGTTGSGAGGAAPRRNKQRSRGMRQ
jgi:hypothetical protein